MDERLVSLDVPRPSFGAPLPLVFAAESDLVLVYRLSEDSRGLIETVPRAVSINTQSESVALLTAETVMALQFGAPNDEALGEHRLYNIGLLPYSAFEVLNSKWVLDLEKANSNHSHHQPALFEKFRHYIFTFQDSTLEFVAERFSIEKQTGSLKTILIDAVNSMR